MPRRRALTKAQLENLLALPVTEADLMRHWTLGDDDLALVGRRRRNHNQVGFALQLCALRYPGRLLRPGEIIPRPALRFVADQLGTAPEVLTTYAVRFQTRYEQLGALRTALGFTDLSLQRRQILEWLLPVALATTNPFTLVTALLDEMRRRRIIVSGPSIIERLVAATLASAERYVTNQLTGGLTAAQSEALEALPAAKSDTTMSVLAWARLPPGAPGHTALKRLAEQLACVRAVGLDPTCADGVHAERLRKLAREGARFTAQHLRVLSPLRRRATLVATVLDTTVRLTDDGVGLFDRKDVTIKAGDMKITPLKAITPEAAEDLADRLYGMIPTARVTSLLAEVHRWTGFANLFTHQQTDLAADDPCVVLTGVLAEATNLGLSRMADACSVASLRKLAWTAGWHLREDTYRSALPMLANAQHSQPLAALFGAADVSSSDGQGFPTAGRGEAVGAINAHYGREMSALFYTHVSARHAPYHTVAIPPSGEAAYGIDGLLYHEADFSIATHHTDGGGVSDHVFALAHLLGFCFAPRIPNLAERRLYGFGPASNWPVLAPFIAGRPDERLIIAHWDDVLRLAASVRTGTVSASLMLKHLGAYPRQNGLALALREIGRIERTLYTLGRLEQAPLIPARLNIDTRPAAGGD